MMVTLSNPCCTAGQARQHRALELLMTADGVLTVRGSPKSLQRAIVSPQDGGVHPSWWGRGRGAPAGVVLGVDQDVLVPDGGMEQEGGPQVGRPGLDGVHHDARPARHCSSSRILHVCMHACRALRQELPAAHNQLQHCCTAGMLSNLQMCALPVCWHAMPK